MTVLGLDPGIERLGYAVLKSQSSAPEVLSYGLISTSPRTEKHLRLHQIWQDIGELVEKFKPDTLALESLIFAKNVKTGLVVSEVRGVLLLAGATFQLRVLEFTPLQVKTRLTGYGRANKAQMQNAVRMLLSLRETPRPDDVADALAIALCGIYHQELTP